MNNIETGVIGLMSGTSMDGVDIVFSIFTESSGGYQYRIEYAETIPYSPRWKEILGGLPGSSALNYASAHVEYGHYLGKITRKFIEKYAIHPAFIASHGHTIFHQPGKGFTSQVGDGASISAECNGPVVCDFRASDLAWGGEGAPLVPIGDALLFSEYDYCLNLGGFSNISFDREGVRMAYDICPVNIVLNKLANEAGYDYDMDGILASKGDINDKLLDELNLLSYYSSNPPKSLGREWVEKEFDSVLLANTLPLVDRLRTVSEHIACQLSQNIKNDPSVSVLTTGGGSQNQFLVSLLEKKSRAKIIIPNRFVVDYKEALIFAFLGLLRMKGLPNCLASVTGARKDVIAGCVYLP